MRACVYECESVFVNKGGRCSGIRCLSTSLGSVGYAHLRKHARARGPFMCPQASAHDDRQPDIKLMESGLCTLNLTHKLNRILYDVTFWKDTLFALACAWWCNWRLLRLCLICMLVEVNLSMLTEFDVLTCMVAYRNYTRLHLKIILKYFFKNERKNNRFLGQYEMTPQGYQMQR